MTECNWGLPEWRSGWEAKGAVGYQPGEWIVAVTEKQDETSRGERRGRPNPSGKHWELCPCLPRHSPKAVKRREQSTVACSMVFS